jgi:hypothetical protein
VRSQEEGGEFAASAPPAVAEPWDDKYAAPTFDGAAAVAGQWSEQAAPGWEAAVPGSAAPDYSAGNVDFASSFAAR